MKRLWSNRYARTMIVAASLAAAFVISAAPAGTRLR